MPEGEIVDSAHTAPGNKLTDGDRLKSAATRAAKKALQSLQRLELAPGVTVYPDSPPGVGWVLDRQGFPRRYLATRELAIAHYEILTASDP